MPHLKTASQYRLFLSAAGTSKDEGHKISGAWQRGQKEHVVYCVETEKKRGGDE
jgi:hypothetical protein